nr:wall-associated receptor kinase 5-like isoform X2 [Setaria viridis]
MCELKGVDKEEIRCEQYMGTYISLFFYGIRYRFSRQDLIFDGNNSFASRVIEARTMPLVLDWAIRDDGSCRPPPKDGEASAKPTAPACVSRNSFCISATQGPGYLCNCSEGYMGNPYVTGDKGCTNINECDLRKSNPEKYEKLYPCYSGSTCHDTQGSYKCKCKFGLKGDGKSEKGCQPIFPVWAIPILGIIVVAVVATFAIFEVKRRKHRRFFDRNGGDILKSMGINIFTEGQLKKITNGYKKSIGEGAFGKVYIGVTDDSQQVAVKCSTAKGEVLPQEEFVNEITFQFRISHTNLVRLVGCCLETDVPMLVFEFVPRGSLHSVLHGAGKTLPLSMPVRLDIAIGSAEALAYMHSHGGHNHVHGDIKSGNILLDDNLTPKVSDFGSAKLVSVASRYSKWCVSGDMSYIDPIYIKSGRFTEKSDVYSFGVVLLELVTRKPAKYGDNSLYIDFIRSFKEEGNGRKLYDEDILSGNDARSYHHMECLDRISRLAVQCLKEDVDERPTMAEVVEELKEVKAIASGGSSSVAS